MADGPAGPLPYPEPVHEHQGAPGAGDPSLPGPVPPAPGPGGTAASPASGGSGDSAPAAPPFVDVSPAVPAPAAPGSAVPAPRSDGGGRPLRLGRLGTLVRRRRVLLEESRVDPEADAPAPEADTAAVLTLRGPVATGFLLASGVLLALAVLWILQTNGQLLMWIAAALFIALGLDPLVRRIESWGAPRWAGVLAAALGMAAVVAAFVSLLVPTVVEQSTQLVTDLPGAVEDVMVTPWFQAVDREFHIQDAVRGQLGRLTAEESTVSTLFGGLLGLSQTVMNAVFSTVVIVVLTLYFLASLPHMKYWAYRLAPRSRRPRVEELSAEITSSVGHYVMGQTLVAVLNGTVAFIAMSVAGTPFTALLAFFAAIMAFIPLVGALIGGVVITVISLLTSWETAALFAAIYFVYLQVEAYVVSPRVMARAVAVPPAVAVIAVIAGGTLLGVLGALMAIPTAAAVLLLVREVLIPRQDAR